MWNRAEVKMRGKASMKANYWRSVLVALLFALVCGGGPVSISKKIENTTSNIINEQVDQGFDEDFDNFEEAKGILAETKDLITEAFSDPAFATLAAIILIPVILGAIAIGSIIGFLIINPLTVGIHSFFMNNNRESATISHIGDGFERNYKRNVVTMLLKDIYRFLWTLLFVIPGIVKGYEYRMIPYILADHDDISRKEAFARSKEMMDGNKWKAFVFDLSFIGWHILSVFTLGLLEVFYVRPYYENACAALYEELK